MHTGIYIALPEGYECLIRPRGGLALKRGLTVLNTPGTIDADYRGKVGVILVNLSNEPQTIENGERICQMVVARHSTLERTVVEDLDETERGAGGPSNPGNFTDIQVAMQPYVALSEDNQTLTFYKDGQITTHIEPTFLLNEPEQTPGWNIYRNVTTVVLDLSFAPVRLTHMGDWFNDMRYLTSIQGLENLNTSEVTSMKSLFNGCTSLASEDLKHFDTGNVTNMNGMFRDCSSMRQLDLSSFDTRKVTDMNSMFRGCTSLESLDLSSFDTHSLTRMIWMFYNCSNLTTIYAGGNWDTAGVTTSANMFSGCTSLVGGKGTTYNESNPKDKTYAQQPGLLHRQERGPAW